MGSHFYGACPEHDLVEQMVTPEHKEKIEKYIHWAKNRSERERIAEVTRITGEFTGAYGIKSCKW